MPTHYSANNIKVLEGLEAVRKRPAMYIGDTGTKGLHHLVWEAVDNAVDEHLAGYCNTIQVHIHADNGITVKDNGRGIPVGMHPKENRSALEVVMTVLHAGGKFDQGTYKVSGGLHGVGISCVNALSSHMKVDVYRDGAQHTQSYAKGIPLAPVRKVQTSPLRGTTVSFEPDASIFTHTSYNHETIAKRMHDLAFLNPGLKLELTDFRQKNDQGQAWTQSFYEEGGLAAFVSYLNAGRDTLLPHPIAVQGEKNGVAVQVAFTYNEGHTENIASYVNNIITKEGGTHVTGLRRALTRQIKKYGDASGILAKVKVDVIGDDFKEGLTAVIAVQLADPLFEGQTKARLGSIQAQSAVESCVAEVLKNYLEENPNIAKAIIRKGIFAAEKRQALRKARELFVQRKNILSSTSLPGKLADCAAKDPAKCELFLVEGDSAGGTAKQGRDRLTQAILPLRGKILNVEKALEYKIYGNEEIKNMITALGLSFGTHNDASAINIDKLRYHKIIIMTDADVDGSHIRTLILTFFFRYLPILVERGYIYIAQPPLYLVKKGNESYYCWNDEELEERIAAFKAKNTQGQPVIQRYKGLGEMNASQLWDTTLNPVTRTLKQVTIQSAIEADYLFSVLMGSDVQPRKTYIQENARYATLDC